jgi:uncharacterized LabA/DUF88 family protein
MKTYAFIDASNLFYGGEKSLGWKIDYKKLLAYLKSNYGVSRAIYFGGVETHRFEYDYLSNHTVSLKELEKYINNIIETKGNILNEAMLLLLSRHLQRIRFYYKLEQFGYELHLKPVKLYKQEDGRMERKANCDVDMAFELMKEKDSFDRVIILSGDGDFLPVLKYLKDQRKEVIILARGPRTAKEIKRFAGGNFRDFVKLKNKIEWQEK